MVLLISILTTFEDLLKETPIAFEVLFDNLTEGGLLIDLATSEISRCNGAFAALLGYDAEVIQSGNHLSLLPERQSDGTNSSSVLKALIQGALTSETVTMEMEYLHGTGRILDLEVRSIPIPEANDLCFFLFKDLTGLREAEEFSDLNQQRFETIFKQAPISIAIGSTEDEILSINPQFTQFLGYTQEEILGKSFSEITHPDDEEKSLQLHRKMLETKGERFKMAKRYLRKDGTYVWGQSVAIPMYDENDNATVVLSMQLDIHEQKQAQEDLAEQEMFLRSITENLNDGVLVVGKSGDLKYMNTACQDFIGLSNIDLHIKHWSEVFGVYDPDEVTRVKEEERPMIRALNGETLYGVPLFIRKTADGIGRHVLLDAIPLKDENGEFDQVMGVFRDISEIRSAEQEIEEGSDRISALVRSVPDMIFRMDREGRCLYYKADSPVKLSFDPQDFVGKLMSEVFDPEGYALHYPYLLKAIETGDIQQYEYDTPVDGKTQYFEARIVKASEVEAVVFVRDISERVVNQMELAKNEQRLRALIDAWPDLLFRLSADGVFLDYKAEKTEELLVPPEHFMGKTIREALPPDQADFFGYQIKKALNQEGVRTFEYKVPLPNSELDYEGRIVKAANNELVFFGRNITDKKKQEKELHEVNRQLEVQAAELLELNKDLEHYAYYAAHDIKGPMNNIKTLLMMIKEQDGVKPDSQILFDKAEDAVAEMRRIVDALNDVLGLKKSLQVKAGGSDVAETVDRVMIGLNEMIDGNNVVIATHLKGSDRSILASVHLYSVLQNLVINAIRYQRAGVRNKIEINSVDVDNMLELHVKDNGMGIDLEANRSKLFRMFKRFHDHVPGRGIGLYMVKSIVESYGGTIDVESVVDEGTEFTIRIPQK